MSQDNNHNGIQAAIEAGKQIGAMRVMDINGVPAAMIPDDMQVLFYPEFMPRPHRINARVEMDTANSFLDYFNEFATDDSVIFCDVENGKFYGVLDYHQSTDAPTWGDHVVIHECAKTKEWRSWNQHNGEKMDQVSFAFFLEQNLDEIVRPEAAQMLEIALTLKAKTKLNFESGNRLSDGQVQFQYREELDGSAGVKGDIKIPETFGLGLRVFEGGDAYSMEARFRYRIREGKVLMWYDLVRPHKVHRAAVEDVFQKIKQHAKARMVLHGRV